MKPLLMIIRFGYQLSNVYYLFDYILEVKFRKNINNLKRTLCFPKGEAFIYYLKY